MVKRSVKVDFHPSVQKVLFAPRAPASGLLFTLRSRFRDLGKLSGGALKLTQIPQPTSAGEKDPHCALGTKILYEFKRSRDAK